ncbi:MAG: bacteriohemerythrin [Desulforhopalus sp.]
MARLDWDESLSVHNKGLDNQHKELMLTYNNLHESLLTGSHEDTIKTKVATLNSLRRYITYHFESEERFLESIAFPGIPEHRRRHQEFTDKIQAFQRDIDQERMVLSTSLMKLMRNWIVHHIAQEDKQYADHYLKMRSSK